MSGIEIAGLVLGSFPLLVSCLDYYQKGFEPLEEWWNFRSSFHAFIDDISHQKMRYEKSMIRLLDPIISDNEALMVLVRDATAPRWKDGSLDDSLRDQLGNQHNRFLRVLDRMEDVMLELKGLLRIEDDKASWLAEERRPLGWHLLRLRLSFSKGKFKKVKRLAKHNTELEEILSYSEWILPIVQARKSSKPVALFEKLRQLACGIHSTLNKWECSAADCHSHLAHLRLQVDKQSISLDVLFTLDDLQGHSPIPRRHEVTIQPVADAEVAYPAGNQDIGILGQATALMQLQDRFEEVENVAPRTVGPGWSTNMKKTAASGNNRTLQDQKKRIRFAAPSPGSAGVLPSTAIVANCHTLELRNLCSSLRTVQTPNIGILADEDGRAYEFMRPNHGAKAAPTAARLISLSELLDEYHKTTIDIPRQRRFAIAAHIASALLQMSPWLTTRWSKHDLYFFVDSQTVCNDWPYIPRQFVMGKHGQHTSPNHDLSPYAQSVEDEARICLSKVGIMILELIFGYNIESCNFHREFYGPNNQPNDLTNICTARKLAKRVLGDSGAEISDVVRRCLNCEFALDPNFQDKKFKEAIYEGVIRPLTDYMKVWQPVMP